MASFISDFCAAVATKLAAIGLSPTIALFANYDATRESGLKLTVCPAANYAKRAGRGLLEDRVYVAVVVQKRVDYPTLEACEDALNLARTIALALADCNVTVDGLNYIVADVENTELFDERQLEEGNVFSNTLTIEYVGIGQNG